MGLYQKFYVLKRRCLVLKGLALLIPVLFVGFCSSNSFAASLTMTLSSASLSFNILPNSTESTFASSGNLGISVSLTGPGGYTLGIKAASSNANARNLINSTANTALTTISSAITPANYTDNTYASTNNLNNTWAYLPSKYNSADNTNYRPAPDANGDILEVTAGDGNGTAVNYTISMGVRANTSTKPGAYSNTFVIVAVANIPDCNPLADDIDEAVCLQDMNDNVINSMTIGTQYRLYDGRDYKKYYIARMKDGKVWMTQNLDLDLISNTKASNYVALTSENTDLNEYGSNGHTTSYGYSCSNKSSPDCTAAGEVITWVPSTTTYTISQYGSWGSKTTTPESWDRGDYYSYRTTANSGTIYSNKSSCERSHGEELCAHIHVGNYYNFSAATATNDTSTTASAYYDDNYYSMPNSICPAGWRLPTGRTEVNGYTEVNILWIQENITNDYKTDVSQIAFINGDNSKLMLYRAPLYYVPSGYKINTSNSTGGAIINETSTISSSTNNYVFETEQPVTTRDRGYGNGIRCVARQSDTGNTVITFDKNASDATGTTGANNTQTINANTLTTLSTNGFTRSGYIFNSWNTEPDGSGRSYTDVDKYYAIASNITTNVTLYAQWDKGYIITFNTNNANGVYFDGNVYANGQSVMAYEGHKYVISGDYATRYTFSSWSVTAGTIENNSYQTTYYTMPSSDVTITLTGQAVNTKIKDLTLSACPTTPTPVYDERDNEVYWVAKLNDNNCWMLDNLRLDLTNSTVINNLSVDNTNADATSLTSLKNGNRTNGNQYATAGLSGSNWTSSYSYSVPMANVSGTVTSGVNDNTWTGSYTKDTIAPVFFGAGSGKVGVHYNYCAASAGSYCYGSDNYYSGSPSSDPNTVIQPTARDIASDICPKGWKMPTGGNYDTSTGGGNYQNLYNKYSGAAGGQAVAFNSALSAPLVGYYGNDGSIHSYGYTGFNWSSTWGSLYYMYRMYNYNNSVASNGAYRYAGYPIRCIREPDTINVTVNFAGSGIESVTFKNENGISQTVTSSGTTITLQKGIPNIVDVKYTTKHNFASWSATAGTPVSSTQNIITYTTDVDSTVTIAGQEVMIDMTTLVASTDPISSNCKNETISPILVYDPRDNETYWVARLCDGKYWMLDNLRLDLSKALPGYNGVDKISLTTSNTNASEQAIACLLTGSYQGNACTSPYSTSAVVTKTQTTGSWSSNSYNAPNIATSGNCNSTANCSNNPSGKWDMDDIAPVVYGLGSGKIGIYYNYCAVSAGSYCYASNAGSDVANTLRDIESDICPTGWYLPTDSNNTSTVADYNNFLNAYSGAVVGQYAALRDALSTPLAGSFSGTATQGTQGYFWSSTRYSTSSMSIFLVSSTNVNTYNSLNRGSGGSVRCVFGS